MAGSSVVSILKSLAEWQISARIGEPYGESSFQCLECSRDTAIHVQDVAIDKLGGIAGQKDGCAS